MEILVHNGWSNVQKAICTAIKPNGSCHTVLMELHSTDDSERILNDLVDSFRSRSLKVGPMVHDGGTEKHIYYRIDLSTLEQ